MGAQTDLQFDGWTVNRVSGEMSHGSRTIRLPQQPLRILVELFDHAGEVVTREHLVKVLWPEGVVDFDNGLNVAMRKLRVALDDVGDVPRYIETLPRVGYRFIGKRGATETPAPAPRKMPPLARIAVALGIAGLAIALAISWWSSTGTESAAAPRHVPSVRAHELYLEALSLRSRRDIETSSQARAKLEAAIKEDPEYAQAWAALADANSAAVIRQLTTPAEGVAAARAAAERAIALDDNVIEGHSSLGQILMDHYKDFAGAQREFERARAINENAGRLWHHYGMWYGHQGRVEAASDGPGRGALFTVTLPCIAAVEPQRSVPQAAAPGSSEIYGRRVLVVDDNVDAAESTAAFLRLEGHEVKAVHDGLQALSSLKVFDPHVVVLDIGLPGLDGYAVARQLRSRGDTSHVLLIALTGYGQKEDRARAAESGFDYHFVKPADPREIQVAIERGRDTSGEPVLEQHRIGGNQSG